MKKKRIECCLFPRRPTTSIYNAYDFYTKCTLAIVSKRSSAAQLSSTSLSHDSLFYVAFLPAESTKKCTRFSLCPSNAKNGIHCSNSNLFCQFMQLFFYVGKWNNRTYVLCIAAVVLQCIIFVLGVNYVTLRVYNLLKAEALNNSGKH